MPEKREKFPGERKVFARALSHRERVAEGRVRDFHSGRSLIRPSGTFSRWEKARATALSSPRKELDI
jgi:hypothetical protein